VSPSVMPTTWPANSVPHTGGLAHKRATIVSLLQEAQRQGLEWRDIYRGVYALWKDRRPLFPDPKAMTARIETPKTKKRPPRE